MSSSVISASKALADTATFIGAMSVASDVHVFAKPGIIAE
jgi:hypothetical protein